MPRKGECLPDEQARRSQIQVRLTPAERRQIRAVFAPGELSAWIRAALLAEVAIRVAARWPSRQRCAAAGGGETDE